MRSDSWTGCQPQRPPLRLVWAAVLLAAAFSVVAAGTGAPAQYKSPFSIKDCNGRYLHILDVRDIQVGGDRLPLPPCSLSAFSVSADNGKVYLAGQQPGPGAPLPHQLGAAAGSFYIQQALRASQYYRNSLDQADLIFVDDYCYYTWALAYWNTIGASAGPEAATPGDYLLAAYQALVETNRYKARQGQDYVFFDPHPGWATGAAEQPLRELTCNALRHSMHIVGAAAQRAHCNTFPVIARKLLVAPLLANVADPRAPRAAWAAPPPPFAERDTFLYARHDCGGGRASGEPLVAGRAMRAELGGGGPDRERGGRFPARVAVQCSEAAGRAAFREVLDGMRRSLLCLVTAGDSPATPRLAEAFMAGCIPTFVGPPYHAMPLAKWVGYSELGLVVNVTRTAPWLPRDMEWRNDTAPRARAAPWTWIPDAPLGNSVIEVTSMQSVVRALKRLPKHVLARKLLAVAQRRELFSYVGNLTHPPSAANLIVSEMCALAG